MITDECWIKTPDNLQLLAFYKLMTTDTPSNLSVLQALIMEGDTNTVKTILQFSPSSLDISIALVTTGTAAFLASRMRIQARHQSPNNALIGPSSPRKIPRIENGGIDAIVHILDKIAAKYQNKSLLREVISKGSLSQVLKVLAQSKKFSEDKKTYLSRADLRGTTLLMSACSSGRAEVVEFLLAHGALVQVRNHRQRTALHFAASNISLVIVKLLLRAGAWIYDEDDNGMMSLHCACQNGRTETAVFLIENGCDVDRPAGPNTPHTHGLDQGLARAAGLHFAARNGHNETVAVLLQKGAKIDSVTSEGQTPLMLAAESGHMTTAQFLIQKGANVNAIDSRRRTALEYAALKERLPVVKLLVDAGISLEHFVGTAICERLLVTVIKHRDVNLLLSLIDAQNKIRDVLHEVCLNPWNKTLLHVAAENTNNAPIVDLLCTIFGDVNVRTSRGQTPLHFAADVNNARRLVEAGAMVSVTDQFGETPAMAAARNNHWEVVEFLIQENNFISKLPNKFGQTLESMAVNWQAPESVSRLLEVKS